MKINSIQRNITLTQGSSGYRSDFSNSMEKKNDMYKSGLGYCGSFTGKSEAAAVATDKFSDKLLSSDWFGRFTQYSYEHNIATSSLIALVLAGIMRPATIMALPGKKDKEDKIYASGQAVASGLMGFIVSTIVTSPFDESIKKVFDKKTFRGGKLLEMDKKIEELNKQKELKTITEEAKKELKELIKKRDALSTLVKNIPDWVIGVPRAMLTIALIPPILKYVFGLEKKKKTPNNEPPKVANNNPPKMDFINKEVFKAVKGGVQ